MNSLSVAFEKEQNFDAIFCLAVFQHPENRHNLNRTTSAYAFDKYEKLVVVLNQKLKPGGLLFIDQTDFNFLETAVAKQYTLATVENNAMLRERPLFNKKGIKISEKQTLYRVFRKK